MPLHLVFLGNWDPHFGNADRPEIARMLIEHGADVSTHNKDGQTPSLHVVFLGNWDLHFGKADRPEIARMLIEHGEDVSAQDKHSQDSVTSGIASSPGRRSDADRAWCECVSPEQGWPNTITSGISREF